MLDEAFTRGKLAELLLLKDTISGSNILHQICNQVSGSHDWASVTTRNGQADAEKTIEAFYTFMCTIVGAVDRIDRAKQAVVALELLSGNTFRNTPMHLLFAHIPTIMPRVSYKVANKLGNAAGELVKLAKKAFGDTKPHVSTGDWRRAFATKNEHGYLPLEVLQRVRSLWPFWCAALRLFAPHFHQRSASLTTRCIFHAIQNGKALRMVKILTLEMQIRRSRPAASRACIQCQ